MINKRNNRRVASVTRLRKKRQIRKRYKRIELISGCVLVAGIATVFQEMLENNSQYADNNGAEIRLCKEYN